jgi:uncharacterized C2H2 Zn-finger protein
MLYECPRCHYSSENKGHYVSHLKKQKSCPSTYSNEPMDKILADFIELKSTPKAHKCTQCDKSFSFQTGLSRHMKEAHITINNINNTTDNSNHHNDNSTHIDNSVDNSVTNNIHNTYNITIQINPFGSENLDHLTPEFLTKCLKDALGNGIPDLIANIHLNKDVPENHNITHKSSKWPAEVNVFLKEGDKDPEWTVRKTNEIIGRTVKNSANLLQKHIFDEYDKLDNPTKDDDELRFERIEKILKAKDADRRSFGPIRDKAALKFKLDKQGLA